MKHKLLKIQITVSEAQALLRILYDRKEIRGNSPLADDLIQEIEAALDDASIEDE